MATGPTSDTKLPKAGYPREPSRAFLGTPTATRIYLAAGVTDMRNGFEGLYGLVRDRLSCEPLSGHRCVDPIQTCLTPAPVHSPGGRTYSYQNQDVPRSGARPTTSRPTHSSVCAPTSIPWWLTPLAPVGRLQERFSFFPSTAVSSDADQACRSSNRDCGKTRSAAYRCSQTPPLTA